MDLDNLYYNIWEFENKTVDTTVIKSLKEKHQDYLKKMMKHTNIYSIELFNDGFHIYKYDNIFIPDIIIKPEDCSIHSVDNEMPYWFDLGNYYVLALNFLNGDFSIYDMY